MNLPKIFKGLLFLLVIALFVIIGVLAWRKYQKNNPSQAIRPIETALPSEPAEGDAPLPEDPEHEAPKNKGQGAASTPETGAPLPGAGFVVPSSDGAPTATNDTIRVPVPKTKPREDEPVRGAVRRHYANPLTSTGSASSGNQGRLPFTISHLHSGGSLGRSRTSGAANLPIVGNLANLPSEVLSGNFSPETISALRQRKSTQGNADSAGQNTSASPIGREKKNVTQQRGPSKYYLHSGTLVEVQLINTLESFSQGGPILGLIVHDVKSMSGELVLPAGTRVIGEISGSQKDRIFTSNTWRAIPLNGDFKGRSLSLSGRAMTAQNSFIIDRNNRPEFVFFGPDDMKLGLCGYVIQPQNWNEMKLFVAGFLKEFSSSGLQTNTNQLSGYQVPENSLKNSALGGLGGVMDKWAEGIEKQMEQDAPYTLVPGGSTSFYIFLDTPADMQISSIPLAEDAYAQEKHEAALAKESSRTKNLNYSLEQINKAIQQSLTTSPNP